MNVQMTLIYQKPSPFLTASFINGANHQAFKDNRGGEHFLEIHSLRFL